MENSDNAVSFYQQMLQRETMPNPSISEKAIRNKSSMIPQKGYFTNQLERCLSPVLLMFHFINIDQLPCPTSLDMHWICRVIWKYVAYLYTLFMVTSIVYWLVVLVLTSERILATICCLSAIIIGYTYYSVFRSRSQIRQMLMRLSQVTYSLNYFPNMKFFRIFIISYCSFLLGFTVVIFVYILIYSEELLKEAGNYLFKTFGFCDSSRSLCYVLQDIFVYLLLVLYSLLFAPLACYYSVLCMYIKNLLNEISKQLRKHTDIKEYTRLFRAYEECTRIINCLDQNFSCAAFMVVLSCMLCLLWFSFETIFSVADNFLPKYTWTGGIFFMLQLVLVIFSASQTLMVADLTKQEIKKLLKRFKPEEKELRITTKSYLTLEFTLTLWELYPIDKSIIVSCIGTLATYGILLANIETGGDIFGE